MHGILPFAACGREGMCDWHSVLTHAADSKFRHVTTGPESCGAETVSTCLPEKLHGDPTPSRCNVGFGFGTTSCDFVHQGDGHETSDGKSCVWGSVCKGASGGLHCTESGRKLGKTMEAKRKPQQWRGGLCSPLTRIKQREGERQQFAVRTL